MPGKASVDAVLGPVLGSHRPANVSAVDLRLSVQRRLVAVRHETVAQLVHEHEGGFVLHVEIPGKFAEPTAP
jgi:hypothetical protein